MNLYRVEKAPLPYAFISLMISFGCGTLLSCIKITILVPLFVVLLLGNGLFINRICSFVANPFKHHDRLAADSKYPLPLCFSLSYDREICHPPSLRKTHLSASPEVRAPHREHTHRTPLQIGTYRRKRPCTPPNKGSLPPVTGTRLKSEYCALLFIRLTYICFHSSSGSASTVSTEETVSPAGSWNFCLYQHTGQKKRSCTLKKSGDANQRNPQRIIHIVLLPWVRIRFNQMLQLCTAAKTKRIGILQLRMTFRTSHPLFLT